MCMLVMPDDDTFMEQKGQAFRPGFGCEVTPDPWPSQVHGPPHGPC